MRVHDDAAHFSCFAVSPFRRPQQCSPFSQSKEGSRPSLALSIIAQPSYEVRLVVCVRTLFSVRIFYVVL
jgi:hypothetical protein